MIHLLSLPLDYVFLARRWPYTSQRTAFHFLCVCVCPFPTADYQRAYNPQWRLYGKNEKRMFFRRIICKFQTVEYLNNILFCNYFSSCHLFLFGGWRSVSCKKGRVDYVKKTDKIVNVFRFTIRVSRRGQGRLHSLKCRELIYFSASLNSTAIISCKLAFGLRRAKAS